jgi:hypothetical protein
VFLRQDHWVFGVWEQVQTTALLQFCLFHLRFQALHDCLWDVECLADYFDSMCGAGLVQQLSESQQEGGHEQHVSLVDLLAGDQLLGNVSSQ